MDFEEMIAQREEIKREIARLKQKQKLLSEEIKIARYGVAASFEHGPLPKSGVHGVGIDKRTGRWFARIRQNGVQHWLGTFDTMEAAIAARKEAVERRVELVRSKWS